MLNAIIEFIGHPGSGKTILAALLAKSLQPATVLLVDAANDQGLSRTLCGKSPSRTLAVLVQEFIDNQAQFRLMPGHATQNQAAQQAIDWAFHDMPVPVPGYSEHSVDLITVGPLTERLPQDIIQAVRYGLTRLFEAHDCIIIDGYHPLLHPMIPVELLNVVVISHPEETDPLPDGFESVKTPNLIISQFGKQPISESLQASINAQRLQLIGKLPVFASEEEMKEKLPAIFQDCLIRMNLPFTPAPRN